MCAFFFTQADTYTHSQHQHINSLSLFFVRVRFDGIVALSKAALTKRQQCQTKISADREHALTSQAEYKNYFSCSVFIRAIPLRNKCVWLRAEKPHLSKGLLGGEGLASHCCKTVCVMLRSHIQIQSSRQSLASRESI